MGLQIRRLHPEEWQTYRDVRLASLKDTPSAFASTYDDALQFEEARWREALAIPAWLACCDDRPVGLVRLGGLDGELPHLLSMWVAPSARGSAAGALLVQAALDQARSQDKAGVSLRVVTSNARAQSFYRRCGFVDTGACYTLSDGRPEIEMEHLFAGASA